jgi:hypothetical protein
MEEYKKLNAVLHLMSDKKTKMLLTISENLNLDSRSLQKNFSLGQHLNLAS